jgi:hypothetical protein
VTPTRAPSSRSPFVHRRRRLALLAGVIGVAAAAWLVAAALGGGSDADPAGETAATPTATPTPTPPPELPGGGRRLIPDYRVVAYYGAPQDEELGALGIGTPDRAARRLKRQARPYARKTRPVMPALELITVLAHAAPGEDGMYRARQTDAVIRRYLRAARRHDALLILDIQPGRADFFTEATRLRKWLKEPDVGLALDPEWRVGPDELPGRVIGRVSSREVNATSAWLDQLTRRHDLPEKLFVIHQFTDEMIDEANLKPRENLAMVLNVDGFGGQEIKKSKYAAFAKTTPETMHPGYKLFYREDTDLMTPAQVMRMRPRPDLVVYE